MVPAGEPTDRRSPTLAADSAARRHHHRRRQLELPRHHAPRGRELAARAASHFIDAGTSGGIWGLENGYCLMVGGDRRRGEALRADLPARSRPTTATLHVGPTGAGHYVKMVHNGIEYGLLQAYAEGYRDPARVEELPSSTCTQIADALAARQRRALVAQRARGARVRARRASSPTSRAGSPIPARGAGRCRKRSTSTSPRR